jgi:alkanesulfonate monooxygenase SsuD/methylene tetrahydromethanopterin reductase-like flavin-dependent oxidoreductase (luciferase family)
MSFFTSVPMDAVNFGVFLVPEGNPYETLKARALIGDELGYHSLWVSDHLVGMYDSPASPRLECWTTVAALGAATRNIMLGQLTMAAPFRNPALLAKMAATLDVVTGGRAILSIGAGWHRGEFNGYGFDYGTKRYRAGRLDEAAEIVKLMWTEEAPSFEGRYYSIREAYCSPKPVQKPHMPLMVAGNGEKLTLRTAARHGDMSNFAEWVGTPETFRHKAEVLERHCLSVGRDPDEIRKTWAAFVFIDEDRGKAEETSKAYFSGFDYAGPHRGLVGDPETIAQRMHEYVDEGATLFILSFLGGDWERDARLFMDEVAPEFR